MHIMVLVTVELVDAQKAPRWYPKKLPNVVKQMK